MPTAPDAALLEVDGLSLAFGGIVAVDNCRWSLPRGVLAALIGPNGAGKTTLCNIVGGQLKPNAGRVRFNGVDVTRWPPFRRARLGLIRTFQISRELGALTVLENVLVAAPDQAGESFVTSLFRPSLTRRQDRELILAAAEHLDTFGLYDQRDEYAANLSGGQKRLLELARATMAAPTLLIMDEPMAGVNPALVQRLAKHIAELRERGVTILIIEHNLDVVEQLCDHVIVMANGMTLAIGTMDEHRANQAVVEAYLGSMPSEHLAG
jgi:ABC-type branched-subunit amino acid transport system ATPase component